MSFGDAFWPAFLATAAGAIVGIPCGLQAARLEAWIESRAERRERIQRTIAGLERVVAALRDGETKLRSMAADLENPPPGITNMLIWRPQQAVWDVLSPVILEGVADVGLKVSVARCFEVTRELASLIEQLNTWEAGAHGGHPFAAFSRQSADQLKVTVKERAAVVATYVASTCSTVDVYIAAHRSKP